MQYCRLSSLLSCLNCNLFPSVEPVIKHSSNTSNKLFQLVSQQYCVARWAQCCTYYYPFTSCNVSSNTFTSCKLSQDVATSRSHVYSSQHFPVTNFNTEFIAIQFLDNWTCRVIPMEYFIKAIYYMAQVTSGKIARWEWLQTWQDFSVMIAGIMKIVNALWTKTNSKS